MNPEQASKYADREDLLLPKYLRKFVATQPANLGCNMDTIDFIQGRTLHQDTNQALRRPNRES